MTFPAIVVLLRYPKGSGRFAVVFAQVFLLSSQEIALGSAVNVSGGIEVLLNKIMPLVSITGLSAVDIGATAISLIGETAAGVGTTVEIGMVSEVRAETILLVPLPSAVAEVVGGILLTTSSLAVSEVYVDELLNLGTVKELGISAIAEITEIIVPTKVGRLTINTDDAQITVPTEIANKILATQEERQMPLVPLTGGMMVPIAANSTIWIRPIIIPTNAGS